LPGKKKDPKAGLGLAEKKNKKTGGRHTEHAIQNCANGDRAFGTLLREKEVGFRNLSVRWGKNFKLSCRKTNSQGKKNRIFFGIKGRGWANWTKEEPLKKRLQGPWVSFGGFLGKKSVGDTPKKNSSSAKTPGRQKADEFT